MFKKVKRHNGIREIYLGKKKIFSYVNNARFAEFVENRFNRAENLAFAKQDFNIVYDLVGGGEKRPC